MASNYNYLKPKAGQFGQKGIVQKYDGQFVNMAPYPNFGGFADKGCLHVDDNRLDLEKSPQTRSGKPI